jgi:hypothetical protein
MKIVVFQMKNHGQYNFGQFKFSIKFYVSNA